MLFRISVMKLQCLQNQEIRCVLCISYVVWSVLLIGPIEHFLQSSAISFVEADGASY